MQQSSSTHTAQTEETARDEEFARALHNSFMQESSAMHTAQTDEMARDEELAKALQNEEYESYEHSWEMAESSSSDIPPWEDRRCDRCGKPEAPPELHRHEQHREGSQSSRDRGYRCRSCIENQSQSEEWFAGLRGTTTEVQLSDPGETTLRACHCGRPCRWGPSQGYGFAWGDDFCCGACRQAPFNLQVEHEGYFNRAQERGARDSHQPLAAKTVWRQQGRGEAAAAAIPIAAIPFVACRLLGMGPAFGGRHGAVNDVQSHNSKGHMAGPPMAHGAGTWSRSR